MFADKRHRPLLLVGHAGALGDFILTWPALIGLKNHPAGYQLAGLGRPEYMKLAAKYGLIDRYYDLEAREMADFLLGVKIPPILPKPAGAVLWFKDTEKLTKLLQADSILPVIGIDPFKSSGRHLAAYYCTVIQKHFYINFPRNITAILPEYYSRKRAQYVIIHPGSGSPSKNFSAHFYLGIKTTLHARGYEKIIFIMGPAENTRLRNSFPATETVWPHNVLELSELLEQAVLYVGNDSGVSHLAGFLGIPSLICYRSTDPAVWGVVGKQVHYIVSAERKNAFRIFCTLLAHSDFKPEGKNH